VTTLQFAYASVVFDVDSTLTGIEGVDWLAARRDPDTAAFVMHLTERVMSGELPIETAYAARLDRIAPSRAEVDELASAYRDAVAPDARTCIGTLQAAGVRVVAVTGGIADAVRPFCVGLGIAAHDVRAVHVEWDEAGRYAGFNHKSALVTQTGKAAVVRTLGLPHPILAVGDGSTDLETRRGGAVEAFAAYVGFAHRPRVVADADLVVHTFSELLAAISGGR
jgi:HAD superfamily phosphoserine phosphatase-like hydrolase